MREPAQAWGALRVAVVGNFNPPRSGRHYQAEVLSNAFEGEGAHVLRITYEQSRYWRPLATVRELFQRRSAFDVVCVQAFSYWNFSNAAAAISMAKVLGKRVVVVYRGGAAPQFFDRLGWLALPVLRRADTLVVPSGYLEAAFSKLGYRATVIPNVIDLSQFPFRKRSGFTPRLVWVRHFREGYNPSMALEVLHRLRGTHPSATLTFIGDGYLRESLEQQARARALEGVHFTGQLPQPAIAQRLNEADIFISTTNYDNQPRSLLEAMAAGLPVVSTRVGGVPFLIDDGINGLLVPAGDAAAMADAVSTILNQPELGERLVANAQARLRSFTWETVRPAWFRVLTG